MDATQQIEDSFYGEEDDSDDEHELGEGKRQREPLAILKVFKNNHIPETEVPLYQGENVLGRDPTSCSVPLQTRSVSGRHAVISISVFGPNDRHAHSEATEALLWDLGSLNGTRKGRLKLTPHVRYALTEGDSVVLADLPCQYVSLKNTERNTHTATADGGREKATGPTSTSSSSEGGTGKGVENGGKKSALPPVPVWTDEAKSLQSLQTTPRKPERTLVPESDSDSDGEKHGRRERRKIVASDSASSDLSSPTCSTFLTPANKVIPESEDESSITPSSALKGRFLKTGNDTEVSSDSSKPDPLHFNIDSDTDVEDEEVEMTKATSGTEAAVTAAVDAVNPADLHMDSDTDVEEEEMAKAKSDPEASAAPVKQDSVNPAVTMDSDTDVEENEPVKTDITALSGPEAALEKKKEPAKSAQLNLESDVEDEDVPHIQDSKPPTSHVAEFNVNSDTDVEEDEDTTKAIEPPSGSEADSKDLGKQAKSVDSNKVPDAKMLHHQSDSDTDVEDDITEIRTPTVAKVTGNSQTRSEIQTADERSTDARLDSPVRVQPPAETVRDEFRLDSDTDVEEDEEKMEEKEQKCAEAAVKIHSSTPRGAGLSEEEMETEAFLSPSQLFKRPVLPSLLHPSVSPGGISHTDDDFTVAETQSFVCDAAQADATLDETPQSLDSPEPRRSDGASSFQLGLSDGSHQLPEAEEHDQEPAEEDWQLQATQLYAMKNSEGSTKAGQTQQDLDATQAYTDLMGQEEEEDGRKEEEEEETQPLAALGHSSIHTAETQLIKHRAQNEDNSDHDANEEVVASEPERKAKEDVNDEMQVDSHLSTADTLLLVRSPRQEEHTQPYAFLAAQIQKEQEETEKEEHESRDQEVQETDEGEKAQNEMKESVEQENDEEEGRQIKEMVIEKKNEVTRDGPEEEKKEGDENKRVENDNEVDEARTQPAEADIIVETLPVCEEDEGQEEEQPNEPNSIRKTQPAKVESTQPLEPDVHARDAIAQTLPMCEEEEGQEEEENKPKNSRRPSRRRQTAKAEPKLPVESDKVTHVTIAETQPMCEEDKEEQEEEQQSEAMSTKRSSMRRHNAKAKPAKPVTSPVAIPETLPMCEEEEGQEEKPQKSGRKSRRGRQTAKIEPTQPLEPDSTAETMKTEEEEEEQDTRRSLRGKERGRAASGKGKGRGRAATEKEKRGKRGKVEQEEDSEEEVDGGNKGRGRKDLRQKSKDDDKAILELVEAENEEVEHLKTQEDEESKRLQREKKEEAARDGLERERKEREERTRLKKEREEREECEEREQEEKDRVERERIEREKKEREEKEMKEREEVKRFEREKQLEKEKREQEEKDRLEQERIERENKEKEEKEKLEKEMRERQELEQKLEKERKKEEEKDRLAREKRDREEKVQLEKEMREEMEKQEKEMEQKEKEKESKDNNEGVEKEKRQAPGKQKKGLGRKGKKSKKEEEQELEEGTKERLETEQELSKIQKQECEEASSKKQEDEQADSDAKPRRSRRTTRKSVAPPAGVEDEGGPAKRTRSRSNSSNSVCSEQSTQDSLNEGRRRGGRRKTAEEVNERGRPSGRKTTTTAPSSEKEDIKQAAPSRSNSRSSDRSSSSVATQSRGRGGKGRKSVKAEELEEEEKGEQSAAVGRGRGRGRGGKRPGANDIKAEATGEAEKEEEDEVMAVSEDSVTSQSSSRGRKRGADVSMLTAESPQPTPKTPRRSLAGQTHKVLFTGVVDEDGEKVVVRLGGGLAKGVGDMTHLVTDKVRRTVKFLCAVARGVPIVTPDWLSKCGKAGSFLSPNAFLVKDVEQEKRFNFSLQEALRVASSQPLLQGYEIHVTPSVKPEPAQMKEIITCCGARFLSKMPSAHKAQTVVVSCEEDRALCERARSLSFPVVSAEFLLTGILQQKVDVQTHTLSLSPTAAVPKPAARTRGK